MHVMMNYFHGLGFSRSEKIEAILDHRRLRISIPPPAWHPLYHHDHQKMQFNQKPACEPGNIAPGAEIARKCARPAAGSSG